MLKKGRATRTPHKRTRRAVSKWYFMLVCSIFFGCCLHMGMEAIANLDRANKKVEVFLTKKQSSTTSTQYPRTIVVQKTINKNPFAIEVYKSKDIVSNQIRGSGWEMNLVRAFKNFYLEYSAKHNIPLSELTFLDIGSNIGWFSLNMAALGVNVVAFEPMEQNYEMAKHAIYKKNTKTRV